MVAGESDQWLYRPIVASNRLSGSPRHAEQNKPSSTRAGPYLRTFAPCTWAECGKSRHLFGFTLGVAAGQYQSSDPRPGVGLGERKQRATHPDGDVIAMRSDDPSSSMSPVRVRSPDFQCGCTSTLSQPSSASSRRPSWKNWPHSCAAGIGPQILLSPTMSTPTSLTFSDSRGHRYQDSVLPTGHTGRRTRRHPRYPRTYARDHLGDFGS